MKHPLRLAAIVVLAIVPLAVRGSAQAPASLPSIELPPALARVLTDYETAWGKKDAAALAALFAEDGFVLSSGVPPVRGRAAIQQHYAKAGGPLSLRALASSTSGEIGYIIGAFAMQKGGPDAGKFTLTLKKDAAGRVGPVSPETKTVTRDNSGRYFDTGSVRLNLPSSCSIIAATAVTGLVIE